MVLIKYDVEYAQHYRRGDPVQILTTILVYYTETNRSVHACTLAQTHTEIYTCIHKYSLGLQHEHDMGKLANTKTHMLKMAMVQRLGRHLDIFTFFGGGVIFKESVEEKLYLKFFLILTHALDMQVTLPLSYIFKSFTTGIQIYKYGRNLNIYY